MTLSIFPQVMISEDNENIRLIEESETEGEKNKGIVLPFEPHSITFDNVVYSVDMPQFTHLARLPQDVDKNNVKMFVEEVMELVELTPLRSAFSRIASSQ
ncbi:hypothetical protein H5410_064234 [Solanum commersonii]|uniref:Uncharacterized protein n=1 Tax=Solanum commersonii TaxID=4109 RepID=A0A9J5W0Q1_SOLCO|nr:hypothetical protein H5410_064234 [Solanum commersonii]